jgi:excisionase family DNA binding protein
MTVLSLSEAAAATGLNKKTVRRSLKSGKISGTRDPGGRRRIDAAQLLRVYPPIASATAVKTNSEILNSLIRMARRRLCAIEPEPAPPLVAPDSSAMAG